MPTKKNYRDSKRRKALGLARCSKCKKDKPQSLFEKDPLRRPFGLSSCCNSCNKIRKAKQKKNKYNSLTIKEKRLLNRKERLKKFNLTIEGYKTLIKKQKGVCAICKNPETTIHPKTNELKNLAIDHCHKTNITRGLLCSRCNLAIGLFKENIEIIREAIKYLNKYRI